MPVRLGTTQARLKNIRKYLSLVTPILSELCDAFGSPFLKAISTITLSLSAEAENIKRNKDDCIELIEQVHTIVCAIVDLHIKADNNSILPPAMLEHLGSFTKTLQKIHTYVEAKQDASRFKHFFHQNATKTLLRECKAGLQQALAVFKVQIGIEFFADMGEMQKSMHEKHDKMLALISACSTREPSINAGFASSDSSTASLSMLPAEPKIFHGRETELKQILDIFKQPLH
ncbi:NB-ARC domain-containing protein [Mycena venus]|uniref:NB-ARC domain-containing protein n=1 Tax=Mycena venus TaxID=2733690 RepID=A0A8H6Y5F0_9AGAR|nr:NB-ARC domain-containing protein [Mycena venus]